MIKFIVYKTINKVNGHFYIGVHKLNGKLKRNREYLGSGKILHYAIKKYGIENFEREILFEFLTKKEAYQKEAEIVNEDLLKLKNCYNIKLGGDGGWKQNSNKGKVIVRDSDGHRLKVDKNDIRYIKGELVPYNKGVSPTKESNDKRSATLIGIKFQTNYCSICNRDIGINRWDAHIQSKKHNKKNIKLVRT